MEEQRIDIHLPDLGDVEEVRVIRWLLPVGTRVDVDDDLLEVETEKTTFVVPAPEAGRLAEIVAVEGASVPRGGIVGRIDRSP